MALMTYCPIISLYNSFTTFDPFVIAEQKDIKVIIEPLGDLPGYYCIIHGHKFIHISQDLDPSMQRFVCAHELAHALLHPEVNAFYTLFPIGRYEREANDFAVNLLLMSAKQDYPDFDLYQLASVAGIPRSLLEAAFGHIIVA